MKMERTITISEDTYQKLKVQLGEDGYKEINSLGDMVGKSYFFRTVTYHMTGKVKKVIGNILELEKAAWIADSGRFMQAIKDGKLNEVEPVGVAYINMASVTDFFPWTHKLPEEQK
jgi:hypothetical protein